MKNRPFKQYLGKIVKIKTAENPETRTKVDFLLGRANILSNKPVRKMVLKIRKSQLFETNLNPN